ncbi:MAG: tyrosine-type recombinase/integrase [Planctomycetes bacterium]|nr:tyrosine-type recombinase/integrase [Planctomycetota bacterium]
MAQWIVSPEKFLTVDEVRDLRRVLADAATLARAKGNQAPVRDQLIIELALGTGLRVSEMAHLQVEDLFLAKGQNSLHVRNGKGGKDRLVQFSATLKTLILNYLNYRKSDSPYLLASERGNQITASGIQQLFKKWAKKAGLPKRYSIHSLRHTYATRLYKASGYNLRLVQKQLGHSSVSTTQVYADVQSEDIDEALANLDLDQAE